MNQGTAPGLLPVEPKDVRGFAAFTCADSICFHLHVQQNHLNRSRCSSVL